MTGFCINMCVLICVLCSTARGKENEGGHSANIGQFTFVAFVHTNMTLFKNESLKSIRSSCTGFIVSEKYVLVPGHCVRDILLENNMTDTAMVSSAITVRAGTLVGTANRYVDYGICMQERTAPLTKIITLPPSSASSSMGDIALVGVTPTFDFGPCVGAVAMLKKPFPVDVIPYCMSLTFSNAMVRPGEPSQGVLKYRRVRAGDTAFCKGLMQSASISWREDHICSQTVYKIDSCNEDWTGPVVCKTKKGILAAGMDSFYFGQKVSWLKAECEETDQVFKAYTMLGYHEQWIADSVNTSEVLFVEYEQPVTRRRTLSARMIRGKRRRLRNGAAITRGHRRVSVVTTILLLIYWLVIT